MAGLKRLLLLGAGHAHAQVLRRWIDAPLPGVELSIVSPSALAPYSGMVPGWLAGVYRYAEICIDFQALAAAAGAHWVQDEVGTLDPRLLRVTLAGGGWLQGDVLSLNLGSTLRPPAGLAARVLPLRPLSRLQAAWQGLLEDIDNDPAQLPRRVTAVGGGAAGVECVLAVLATLRRLHPGRAIEGRLFSRSAELLPGLAPGARRAAAAALAAAGVACRLGADAVVEDCGADELLLWAAGAQAHAWQAGCGLAVSRAGFFCVDPQLRSISHPQVFAVGDCAEWAPPLPKAGVYAVRMGPVLDHNLRAALQGRAWHAYAPQSRYLALLATADGRAIAARGAWSAAGPVLGRWAWRWKDRIDRRFVSRFSAPAGSATGN